MAPIAASPDPSVPASDLAPVDRHRPADPTSAPSPSTTNPALDGLRALSALAVLVFHGGTFTGLVWGPRHTVLGQWAAQLGVGVSVFFVLSGYLLFRPFVQAHLADRPGPSLRPYLVRRLARIFPAYWLALAVSAWVLHLQLGDWWGQLRFYGLLQIYWGDTVLGGLVQAWTLCTELSFYLFLPIWAALLARVGGNTARRQRAHYLACGALYAISVLFRYRLVAGGHAVGYAWLPANIDLFALGMVLAVVQVGAGLGRPVPSVLRTFGELPVVAWVAAICCYGAAAAMRYPERLVAPSVGQQLIRQALFGAVAFLVVAPAVLRPTSTSPILRALRWRPLVALGIVSYGVYLWHLSVMSWLMPHLPLGAPGVDGISRPTFVSVVGTAIVLSVTVAGVSWFGVERPILRRVRGNRAHTRP